MARKRGRRPQGEYVGKSKVMGFRIRPDTHAALHEASKASGRSLSQETEHRLRRDLFEHGSADTYAVLRTIGYAIDRLINIKNPKATWLTDPYLFQQAKLAVVTALDLLAPREPAPSREESLDRGGLRQGTVAVHELLRDIQIVDPTTPPAKQTTEQRALSILKSDLKTLSERARPYGKSAEQLRSEAKNTKSSKSRDRITKGKQ